MTHVNLIPIASQRRTLILLRLRQWGMVVISAVLIVAVATIQVYQDGRRVTSRLRELQSRYDAIRIEYEEVQDLQKAINGLKTQTELPVRDKSMLSLLGILSVSAAEVEEILYVRRLELQPLGDGYLLQVQGIGANNVAIAQFAAALRDHEIFEEVELASAGFQQIGTHRLRSYSIKCSF